MAKKYYVVWKGRATGVFTDWASCQKHTSGYPGAKFKSFSSREEAEAAFGESFTQSTRQESVGKKSTLKRGLATLNSDQVNHDAAVVKIFTDGGCDPNPGQAGSGIAVYRNNKISELWYGLYNPKGTNNTAELNALWQAFKMAKVELAAGTSVSIFCDSQYSIQCITQWAPGWEKGGWRRKGGEIKNLDLIKEMYTLHQSIAEKVNIFHVNGHVGIEGNELADRMSMLAIAKQEEDFRLYPGDIDTDRILAMRAG